MTPNPLQKPLNSRQEVILEHCVSGKTVGEIAEIFDLPLTTVGLIVNSPLFQERLKLRKAENGIYEPGEAPNLAPVLSPEWVKNEHKRLAALAEKDGNLSIATRNVEGIGRTLGVYQDNVQVTVEAKREFTQQEDDAIRLETKQSIIEGLVNEGKELSTVGLALEVKSE